MKCTKCENSTNVIDTIPYDGEIYRRHRCTVCGWLFYTVETTDINKYRLSKAQRVKWEKYKKRSKEKS